MIQPPMTKCRAERLSTLMAVLALGVMLLIPTTLFTMATLLESATESYLETHQPRVYFRADVDSAEIDGLAQEVEAWSEVATVTRLDPKANLERLTERLGEERVEALGISPSMLPYGFQITPAVPLMGHVDLAARVAGLEARQAVDAVQIPSAAVVRTMTAASGLVIAGLVMLFLSLLGSALVLRQYLFHLRESEGDQDIVLEVFGATPQQLGTPTLIRGVAVGAMGGLVAALALLVVLSFAHGVVAAVLGVSISAGGLWLQALLAPLLGAAIGIFAALPMARGSALKPVSISAGLQPYYGV